MYKRFCAYHFLTAGGRGRKRKLTANYKFTNDELNKLLESSEEEEEDSEDYLSFNSVKEAVAQGKTAKRTEKDHENYLTAPRKQQKIQQIKQSSSSFFEQYKTEKQKQEEKKRQEQERKIKERKRKIKERKRKIKERKEMEKIKNRDNLMEELQKLIQPLTETFKLKSNIDVSALFEPGPESQGDYYNPNDSDTLTVQRIFMPLFIFLSLTRRKEPWSTADNMRVMKIIKGFKNDTKFNYPVLKIRNEYGHTFQVEDHDGRHRAIALLLLGYTKTPVNIILKDGKIGYADVINSENKKYDTEDEARNFYSYWVVRNRYHINSEEITSKDITYLIEIFKSIQNNATVLKSLLYI